MRYAARIFITIISLLLNVATAALILALALIGGGVQ